MFSRCPKCHYRPLPVEQKSPAACPGCGAILAKLAAQGSGESFAGSSPRTGPASQDVDTLWDRVGATFIGAAAGLIAYVGLQFYSYSHLSDIRVRTALIYVCVGAALGAFGGMDFANYMLSEEMSSAKRQITFSVKAFAAMVVIVAIGVALYAALR